MLLFSILFGRMQRNEKRKEKKKKKVQKEEKRKSRDGYRPGRQELKRGNCDPGNLAKWKSLPDNQQSNVLFPKMPRKASKRTQEMYVYVYVRY